jgi:hypothetical protein
MGIIFHPFGQLQYFTTFYLLVFLYLRKTSYLSDTLHALFKIRAVMINVLQILILSADVL